MGAAIMFAGVLAFLRGSHFAGWLLFIFGGILWVLLPARTHSRTPSRTRATKGDIEGQMQALKAQGWVLRERDDNTALLVRQRLWRALEGMYLQGDAQGRVLATRVKNMHST